MTDTIDHEALRAKYREERDKRIRPDGNEQYLEPVGQFSHLLDDPYTPRVERDPITDEVTFAFIGGGFSGLTCGARMVQAGITDIRIIEGGGDFGGAWYWNRYPGAMCDTAAMVYLPLLEETGHMPSMKYVFAPEIQGHAQRIARTFGLYDKAVFSTNVTELRWDDEADRWIIHTDRGDAIRARFVAMGTGPLHRPKLPGIPGIESYQGHSFHTSRWDYGYTGGDPAGAPLANLADKRVGIIGTGATSVQCIPALGRDSKELYVFQRTPSSIDVRNNHPIDPEWYASLGPGWQQKWLTNFATLQTGGFAEEDLVHDGWTDISKRIRDRVISMMQADPESGATSASFGPEMMLKAYEDSDDEKMEEIRARVDTIVGDPATAEALKPWYRQLCKRPCFHDEYLQTYNLPNVHLVDTSGKGVERIDETGVWVDGQHYEVDLLIYASGFEVGTSFARRSGFETVGRDGETLSEHWEEGMRSLHGMHVHGFPNLFVVGPNQGANLISNITQNLTEAGTTIAMIVNHALAGGSTEVEVTEQAEQDWITLLQSHVRAFIGNPECTPGYYNNEGGEIGPKQRLNGSGYPMGPVAFWQYLDQWRNSGTFEGLTFR
ncbi:MAG: NAD(P)/FAD-dependent oxidoreductase [Acidimicrobiaceae bacterium]|nr:NAD(P)/FAD-dependent oxidoreductase [Acidimicrobiaceae bacterium]